MDSTFKKNTDIREFTPLPMFPPNPRFEKKIIGIISPDIVGPKHTGVGTAYTLLAETLAHAGHEVHLLFVPSMPSGPKKSRLSKHRLWIDEYQKKGSSP